MGYSRHCFLRILMRIACLPWTKFKMAESKLSPLPVRHVDPVQKSPELKYPRWFGGSSSCMAVAVSHPFDLSKIF